MKKQLLALAMLGSGIMSAQTFTQNFSTATPPGLPATWMQNNVDNLPVSTSLASYNFGSNAWVTRDFSSSTDPVLAAHAKVAVSTSWYSPAGISNDWLISPQFTVPANAVLDWDAMCSNSSYPDGYQVKISVTTTATASFTNLLSVGAENDFWTTRAVSLNTYSNQPVYIAFVNNSNDGELLLMDNIRVFVPQAEDGSVNTITSLNRYTTATTQNVAGQFKSFGYNPASTAVLNYNVNNGPVTTQTITFGSPLNYGQTGSYSFSTPANFLAGANKVKVWVTSVNSIAETATANDTSFSTVYVASTTGTRNALIEEWTSSTCSPCVSLNATFDPLLNSNTPNTGGNVNVIKYQVNWPSPGNDPSYNQHCFARRLHYDVNAAPTAITNGRTDMVSHSQAEINTAKAEPAFANITATINVTGNNVAASATITPFVTIAANSPLRVYQALLQGSYNYAGAQLSQKNFYHVMRKMDPNGWGTSVTVADGVPFNATFNHTSSIIATPATGVVNQNHYNFWSVASPTVMTYEYVVFIQDTISNHVLNSGSASFSVSSVGMVELKDNMQIGVYPNPASDFAVVGIKLEKPSTVDITILDITGKMVYNNKATSVDAGQNEIKINISDFASGTYNVIVNTDGGTLKDKLIISK